MAQYLVTYTAYAKDSVMVVSEATIPVFAETAYQAESTVRAMFSSTDCIIRYTRPA